MVSQPVRVLSQRCLLAWEAQVGRVASLASVSLSVKSERFSSVQHLEGMEHVVGQAPGSDLVPFLPWSLPSHVPVSPSRGGNSGTCFLEF